MNAPPRVLILGATGSIGYAVAQNLIQRGWPVTALVRNPNKAAELFSKTPTLTLVEGDVQDTQLLNRLAAEADVIFHGINYPYPDWFGKMDVVTQKIIEAAAQNNATILFPGNVYNFGNTPTPIRPDSAPAPCSRKGALRVTLEQMLQTAAEAGKCRVINLRLPDFWGPGVQNEGIKPIFMAALSGKTIPYLLNADIPHQIAYTPDAAEVFVQLLLRDRQHPTPTPYTVYNFGGTTVPTMRSWFAEMSKLTGHPLNVRVYPRWLFSVLGFFNPMMRELKEMLYLFENSVVLEDSQTLALLPDFRPAPMREALTQTLDWFSRKERKQPFAAKA